MQSSLPFLPLNSPRFCHAIGVAIMLRSCCIRSCSALLKNGMTSSSGNKSMDAKSEYNLWSRAGITEPVYVKVRDALIERIRSGQWQPGMVIPSEFDIAAEFGISAGTARKALALLKELRLIDHRRGSGAASSTGSKDRFRNIQDENGEFVENDAKTIHIEVDDANDMERQRLGLGWAEKVFRLRRVWSYQRTPFMVEDAALPFKLFPVTADNLMESVASLQIGALARECGIHLGEFREQISMGSGPAFAIDLLGIAPNWPVATLDRVVLVLDGRPFEWRMGYCNLAGKYYSAGR
jgi:GntR family transcriptional regulator